MRLAGLIGKSIRSLVRANPGENVREFARARRERGPAPLGLGKMLDQDADDRVADGAHDGGVVQHGLIGAKGAQPTCERVLEGVRGLEQRLQHVVVAVDRVGDERPPEILVGRHPDEDVVEEGAETVLDASGQAFGEGRRGKVGRAPVRDGGSEQIALRGKVVVERRHVEPARGSHRPHARPVRTAARHEREGGFEDAIAL